VTVDSRGELLIKKKKRKERERERERERKRERERERERERARERACERETRLCCFGSADFVSFSLSRHPSSSSKEAKKGRKNSRARAAHRASPLPRPTCAHSKHISVPLGESRERFRAPQSPARARQDRERKVRKNPFFLSFFIAISFRERARGESRPRKKARTARPY